MASPPRTLQAHKTINGIDTECLVTQFQDRWFVLITQIGKIGTIIEATEERTDKNKELAAIDKRRVFSVQTIFGARDDIQSQVLARRLVEISDVPLLVSLSFKQGQLEKVDTLKEFADLFHACISQKGHE